MSSIFRHRSNRFSVRTNFRKVLVGAGVFFLALAWFWYWRPYGFYGGDSEFLDRQINGGLWFRKRELLAVAAMQVCRQIFTLGWGWPVGWSISMASCLAGAFSVFLTWKMYAGKQSGWLQFILVLCSGHLLLYHGSIESYALPTSILMLWVYSIDQVTRGRWPTYSVAFSFALMVWCHLMAFFLFPSLLATLWIHRDRIRNKEWPFWFLAGVVVAWVYVFIDVLQIGQGEGFGFRDLFYHTNMPGTEETGTFLTWQHLKIKLYFLWLSTHITLPFALATAWNERRDPWVLQIAGMVFGALVMVVFFHPDCGYDDWDLFLLPSLPTAVLAARFVARTRWKYWIAAAWILAFLSLWIPRIPGWARLDERGLATVSITNYPQDREVYWVHGETDHYYRVWEPTFYAPGGSHRIAVKKRGYVTQFESFEVHPGDRLELQVPIENIEVPFADRIRSLE